MSRAAEFRENRSTSPVDPAKANLCSLLDMPTGKTKFGATDIEIVRIATEIKKRGYGVLSEFLTPVDLEQIRYAAYRASQSPDEFLRGAISWDALSGTALEHLAQSSRFAELCRQLYSLVIDAPPPEVVFYKVFRRLQGVSGRKNSYIFHFDSYILSALLPITIPEKGARGDLLMFPNVRPIRQTYLANLLDKLLVDNFFMQRVLRFVATCKAFGSTAIPMEPGNVYFFLGYRSIHANEPCDPDKPRITALLHYGDPHRNSKVRSFVRRKRALASA